MVEVTEPSKMKNGDQQRKFNKKSETIGAAKGHEYEKLISIFLLLQFYIKKVHSFYMAAGLKGIGAFDDLVFNYTEEENGETKTIFLQSKHKAGTNIENINISSLISEKWKGDFILRKYLDSYTKIKQRFIYKDFDKDIFKNKLDDSNYYIYTNAELDFKNNKPQNRKRKHSESEQDAQYYNVNEEIEHENVKKYEIENIFNLKEDAQYYEVIINNYTKDDVVFKALTNSLDFEKLVAALVKSVSNKQLNGNNEIFKYYKGSLKDTVIDESFEKFRIDFLTNDQHDLRNTFLEKLLKIHKSGVELIQHNLKEIEKLQKINRMERDKFAENIGADFGGYFKKLESFQNGINSLQNQLINYLSEKIPSGKNNIENLHKELVFIPTDEFKKTEETEYKLKLPEKTFKEPELVDFLNRLIISGKQFNVENFKENIITKIKSVFLITEEEANEIFSKVSDNVDVWWEGDVYLTENDKYIENAALLIYKRRLSSMVEQNKNLTASMESYYNIGEHETFQKYIKDNKILIITTKNTMFTSVKVRKALESITEYTSKKNKDDKYMFFFHVLEIEDQIKHVFMFGDVPIFVFLCKNMTKKSGEMYKYLFNSIIEDKTDKKIIMIMKENNNEFANTLSGHEYIEIEDSNAPEPTSEI